MVSKALLTLSLLANIALVVWLQVHVKADAPHNVFTTDANPTFDPAVDASSDLQSATSSPLKLSGQSKGDITQAEYDKLAYLAAAEYMHNPGIPDEAGNYWRGSNQVGIELMQQKLTAAEAIRQSLLEQYGRDAVNDPLFSAYFFPLGPAFEFLSSDKHIAVIRLRSERRLSMASDDRQPFSFDAIQASEQRYMEAVKKLFTEEEFYEFQLRESRLAQQLRNLNLDWHEDEFRDVYAIRSQAQGEGTSSSPAANALARLGLDPEAAALYDPQVEAVLGHNRYMDYLKAQDHTYRRMQTVAANAGRSPSQVDGAYREYVQASHDVIELRRSGNVGLARQRTEERDQVLKAQWGAELPTDASSQIRNQLSELLKSKEASR